jgi:hypothetical protein
MDLTLLQSIFSRQIFLLYFGKGKFGGKNLLFKRVNSTLQRSFFQYLSKKVTIHWKFNRLQYQKNFQMVDR